MLNFYRYCNNSGYECCGRKEGRNKLEGVSQQKQDEEDAIKDRGFVLQYSQGVLGPCLLNSGSLLLPFL